MKARFALLAMVVVAAAPLAAQGGGGGGGGMGGGGARAPRGVMNVDTMAAKLMLDAPTKAKYQGVIDSYNKNLMPLQQYMMAQRQAQATVDPDSMKKQQAMRTQLNADLKAVLNAGQQKMFDSIVAAQPQGGRRGGGVK